jgi:hypothetical protein
VQSVIPWDIEEELELQFADDDQPNEEHAA